MAVGTIRLFMDNALFFSFNEAENQKDYSLLSMKLKEEVNTLSHLTVTTLFNHPRVRQIVPRKSTFVLTDDDRCEFIGKVLSISRNMSNEVTIEIEDLLGCLRDIVRPGWEYMSRLNATFNSQDFNGLSYDPGYDTYSTIFYNELPKLLKSSVYNSYYTIPNGTVSVDEPNTYAGGASTISDNTDDIIYPDPIDNPVSEQGMADYGDYEISKRDATNIAAFKNYLSVIYDDINAEGSGIAYPSAYGSINNAGSVNVRYVISSYTLRYTRMPLYKNKQRNANGELTKPYYSTPPDFKFGVNLLNFEVEPAVNDPVTAIAPTGTYKWPNENQQRLVMLDTNSNGYRMAHTTASQKYGIIEKNIDFGYIGDYDNYTDAQNALRNLCNKFISERLGAFGSRVTVTGIDPYYLNDSNHPYSIKLRTLVHVVSSPHDIDIYDYCLSREIDFFNHENDQFIIGPFIPSNYFEYNNTNVKRKTVEQIIARGSQYKKETGGLYADNSYVRDAMTL